MVALIEHFHILGGAPDHIIVAYAAGVGAPSCVEGDTRRAFGAAFGGDQHHTVGAAGTVEGGRSGVFQHGH